MLTSPVRKADRPRIIYGVPGTDSYGEPTTEHTFDLSRAAALPRARIARPSSALREVEGFTLRDDEALLLVMRRFTPAGPFRILHHGALWTPTSEPIQRPSLASGVLTVIKLSTAGASRA